jgi:hypothetical protein
VAPDVKYEFIRFGADARFLFTKIVVGIHAGYRVLVGAGEIEQLYWFGGVGGGGLEAGLMGGYTFSENVTGLVGFDYTGYSLSFDPPPVERANGTAGGPLAAGASDTYLQFWLGAAFTVPSFD